MDPVALKFGTETLWPLLKAHLTTPLPYITFTCFIAWTVASYVVADPVMQCFLPKDCRQRLAERRSTDQELNKMARVNSTAFLHSLVTIPLAVVCINFIPSLRNDPFNSTHWLFQFTSTLMCGYFLWDIVICVRYFRLYGFPFLFHGILSFLGLYLQNANDTLPLAYLTSVFMATEVSTPLLHLRWFLAKASMVDTTRFRIVNGLFIVAYVYYRLYYVEANAFWPFIRDFKNNGATRSLGTLRRYQLFFVMVGWCLLNYYWGLLLLKSQLKRFCPFRKYLEASKKVQ